MSEKEERMAVTLYRFKPAHTSFINVEIIVSYSCTEPPKVEKCDISGLKQFAVIVSSEYEVTPVVHSWKRKPCEAVSGCNRAVAYDFEMKVFVKDVIGLGIGIGKIGTGTLGIRFRSTEESLHLTAECICCDDEEGRRAATQAGGSESSALAAIAWFWGFSAFSTALALAYPQPNPLATGFMIFTAFGVVASLCIVFIRMITFAQRRILLRPFKKDKSTTGE
jgi:hypothetical protein